MSSQRPKFSLIEVKRIVEDFLSGDREKLWFSAPRRSLFVVARVLELDIDSAPLVVANGIMTLEEKDFSRTVLQWDTLADEYGLENFKGHNWYVKFRLETNDGSFLEEISFHPIEKELRLANGRVLAVTYREET